MPLPDPKLDEDHFLVIGYCDHARLGCGSKAMFLKNCNGVELLLYDCFGKLWKVRRTTFKMKSVEVRGMVIPHHFEKDGWLAITPPAGAVVRLCPWEYPPLEKLKMSSRTRDVIIPPNREFQLALPPPRSVQIAPLIKTTYGANEEAVCLQA